MGISPVVTTGLHDVDLARRGPCTISILDGHHPDSGPQPVTYGQLGSDLDTAILDGGSILGGDATRLSRRDNGSITRRGISDSNAVAGGSTRAALLRQIDDAVLLDESRILQSGLDEQVTILNIDVLLRVSGLLELAIATNKLLGNLRSYLYGKGLCVHTRSRQPGSRASKPTCRDHCQRNHRGPDNICA